MKMIKTAGNVLAILSIIFVIYTLFKLDIEVNLIDYMPGIIIVSLIGVAISGGTVYMAGIAWSRAVRYFSREVYREKSLDLKKGMNVYVRANIGKYVPGNVMHYVERNIFLGGSGLNQLEVALSSVVEIAGQLCATLMLSATLSYKSLILVFQQLVSLQILSSVGIFLIMIGGIFWILCCKKQLLKDIVAKIFQLEFVRMFLLNWLIYIVVIFLQGSIMVVVCASLNQFMLSWTECRVILTAYTIAWVAGFVIPGAPGGIGVREFVISFMTSGSNLSRIILVAAVVQRIISVCGDICCYVIELRKGGTNEEKRYER